LRTAQSKDLRLFLPLHVFACHSDPELAEGEEPPHLHLPLPLQVFAVILSAAKNPEELNQPQPLGSFTHALSGPLPLMLPVLLP